MTQSESRSDVIIFHKGGINLLNQNDKIERFAEDINKNALNICKKIEKQTEKFTKQQTAAFEKEAKNELKTKTEYESRRLDTETNREISALAAKGKRAAVMHRNEITEKVFEKAEKKLLEFSSGKEYKPLLEKCILSLASAIDGNVIIYVREADVSAAEEICRRIENVSKVLADGRIKIGLAMASNEALTVFADDTFESRLSHFKEQFMSESGLSLDV